MYTYVCLYVHVHVYMYMYAIQQAQSSGYWINTPSLLPPFNFTSTLPSFPFPSLGYLLLFNQLFSRIALPTIPLISALMQIGPELIYNYYADKIHGHS